MKNKIFTKNIVDFILYFFDHFSINLYIISSN